MKDTELCCLVCRSEQALQDEHTIDDPVHKIKLDPKTKIMAVYPDMLGTNNLKTEQCHVN
jgi:hypothetical protein